MNRADFQRLANERIADAKALLAAKRWGAAYYLAGYAVEAALKACIAKLMPPEEFPEKNFVDKCWTPNLVQLLGPAQLKADFDAALKADKELRKNWKVVSDWDESSRYESRTKGKAEQLYEAITDKKHGVLLWFKFRW